MHTPVFLEEVLTALEPAPEKKFIDCTAGEGGHLKKIAETGAQVLALDYDAEQIVRLTEELQMRNVALVNANFKDIQKVATEHGFESVDGILMDLGLSYRQLTSRNIGLSFNKPEEKLDMQIQGKGTTAAYILNTYEQNELSEMFIKNSEETNSTALAKAIVEHRSYKPYQYVGDLLRTIKTVPGANTARIFQALRLQVNDEKDNLLTALGDAVDLLKTEGRLVVITFHSLEDRWVKQFGRNESRLQEIKIRITKNNRQKFERSAQLRVFQKIVT